MLHYMLVVLHTLISRLLLIIVILTCLPFLLICLLMPARWRYDNILVRLLLAFFYRAGLAVTFLSVKVIGKQYIPQDPAVIVANHQSSLDIPLVGKLFKLHPHVWLATSDLLKSPLFRFIMPRLTVLIDMTTPMKGMRSLITAIKTVEGTNRHVVLFPEGERFQDGEIHDFFSGFVILARKTGRPVVPIRIFNANLVYPRGSFLMYSHPITLIVGHPMHIQDNESDEAFKTRVHAWFLAQKLPA